MSDLSGMLADFEAGQNQAQRQEADQERRQRQSAHILSESIILPALRDAAAELSRGRSKAEARQWENGRCGGVLAFTLCARADVIRNSECTSYLSIEWSGENLFKLAQRITVCQAPGESYRVDRDWKMEDISLGAMKQIIRSFVEGVLQANRDD